MKAQRGSVAGADSWWPLAGPGWLCPGMSEEPWPRQQAGAALILTLKRLPSSRGCEMQAWSGFLEFTVFSPARHWVKRKVLTNICHWLAEPWLVGPQSRFCARLACGNTAAYFLLFFFFLKSKLANCERRAECNNNCCTLKRPETKLWKMWASLINSNLGGSVLSSQKERCLVPCVLPNVLVAAMNDRALDACHHSSVPSARKKLS